MRALCKTPVKFSQISNSRMYKTMPNRRTDLMYNRNLPYINSELAKSIDIKLMSVPGFSIDQLMELAGYSVADAVLDYFSHYLSTNSQGCSMDHNSKNVAIFCGPGNNGGDGLVAARHLKHFGFNPTVVYPKKGKSDLFTNLVHQCDQLHIPVINSMDGVDLSQQQLIVDALFGFSFEGSPREPYASMIRAFSTSSAPVLSVDIPSGWHVELGDVHHTHFTPNAIISLTLPKLCTRDFEGVHYIGGR